MLTGVNTTEIGNMIRIAYAIGFQNLSNLLNKKSVCAFAHLPMIPLLIRDDRISIIVYRFILTGPSTTFTLFPLLCSIDILLKICTILSPISSILSFLSGVESSLAPPQIVPRQ